MRVVVALLLAVGCGGVDVEPGMYEVTAATDEDTGASLPLVGSRFTVSESNDGSITIDSLPLAATSLPRDGDGYGYEQYNANINQCEAGGTEHCLYSYQSIVVTAPTEGRLRVTQCYREKRTGCVSSASCGDPKTTLDEIIPCSPPMTIDAKLVPTP
jgi:hypothetical protein